MMVTLSSPTRFDREARRAGCEIQSLTILEHGFFGRLRQTADPTQNDKEGKYPCADTKR